MRPFIAFLPIVLSAFEQSRPQLIRQVEVPADWDHLHEEWRLKWRRGEAGAFSVPLREVAAMVLETVDHFREYPSAAEPYVEIAFPSRAANGTFDSIDASVVAAASR